MNLQKINRIFHLKSKATRVSKPFIAGILAFIFLYFSLLISLASFRAAFISTRLSLKCHRFILSMTLNLEPH